MRGKAGQRHSGPTGGRPWAFGLLEATKPAALTAHLRQMAYMRLTGEIRKGSDFARLRLLLSVPSPRRW